MKLKRIISILLISIIFFTSVTGTSSSATINNNKILLEKKQTKKVSSNKSNDEWPSGPKPKTLSCASAIVMEVSTGSILYKRNIHKQYYPASITKIMTALVALENSSLSDTVTFSNDAVYGIEAGSSTIYSDVGEKMSMEQCLYAIMLESANEVCLAIGEHVAGTSKSFVKMMNDKVKELGLKDTHFNNPNGLPDTKHYTTAYDMAVIAREAIQNSTFRKISSTRSYVCSKTNTHKTTRVWLNHHQMINGYQYPKYEYKYCIGGKTGFTQAAHSTLVTFAEKDGMQILSVIMYAGSPKQGEPNEYTDTTVLLNFGFQNYKKYTIDEEITDINSSLFNTYNDFFNINNSPVRLSNEAAVVLPKGVKLSSVKQNITYNKKSDVQDGKNIIGKVTYNYAGRVVGSTDIIYEKTAGNHLDEASREIVDSIIEDIESNSAKTANKNKRIAKIKGVIINIFSPIINFIKSHLLIVAIIFGAIIVILLIILLIKILHRKIGKKRRNTGGYRSKAGRRMNLKRQRQQRRSRVTEKKRRRNNSKHYSKESKPRNKENRHKKGIFFNKRKRNTHESFGKNFYDF